jgi:integrase
LKALSPATTKTKTIKEYLQNTKLTQKSYHNFINSLNSDVTKLNYHTVLAPFLSKHKFGIERTDEFLNLPIKEIESMIIDEIVYLQQKEKLSFSYINLLTAAIQHLCSMNDVILNWKKIRKFIKTDVARNNEAYTHEDIRKLLEISDIRMKTVFLVLASTGIRIDALHDIRLRNLTKVSSQENIYKVIIYEGHKEQYFTFTTPECSSTIDAYLEYRKRSGEQLNPNSYLIREAFDNNDIRQVKELSRPVATSTLRALILNYLIKTGIREKLSSFGSGYSNRIRHNKAMVHGFRKFVTTQLVNSKVSLEIREMLLGHKIGLASAYYRPSEDEMLNEYLKAVDNLTINEENRLKRKVEVLTIEKSKVDLALASIEEMKKKIGMS